MRVALVSKLVSSFASSDLERESSIDSLCLLAKASTILVISFRVAASFSEEL